MTAHQMTADQYAGRQKADVLFEQFKRERVEYYARRKQHRQTGGGVQITAGQIEVLTALLALDDVRADQAWRALPGQERFDLGTLVADLTALYSYWLPDEPLSDLPIF